MSIHELNLFNLAFSGRFPVSEHEQLVFQLSGLPSRVINGTKLHAFHELALATQNINTNLHMYVETIKLLILFTFEQVFQLGVDGIFASSGRLNDVLLKHCALSSSDSTFELFMDWKQSRKTLDTLTELFPEHTKLQKDDSIILDPRYEFDAAASGPRTDVYPLIESNSIAKRALSIRR